MILFVVIATLFICMLLFPFLLALSSFDKTNEHSLIVKSDNVRDPRYFPKAFGALMEKALENYDGGDTIMLSKRERIIIPPFCSAEQDGVVFSNEDLVVERVMNFTKEIYCRADAKLFEGTSMRAMACLGTLTLGDGCVVGRWVDGERSLTTGDGCFLGISASSDRELRLGTDCVFRRLYAADVSVGEPGEPKNPPEIQPSGEPHRDMQETEDMSETQGNVLCLHNFLVGEASVIEGSLKARGSIHVKRGARISGNLFANGDIIIDSGAFIGGNVFSQGSIYIGPKCQVGRRGRIKSVVARGAVFLSEGTRVFGYVSGEENGETVMQMDYLSLISGKY